MTLIETTRGVLPLDQLKVDDEVTWAPKGRMVTTSYHTLDGELVRRDCWFSLYVSLTTEMANG